MENDHETHFRRYQRLGCLFQPTINYKEKLDILITEHVLDVIWIDQHLAQRGWDVFERHNIDKKWSFTDCTSYVVMKDFGITEAFAFDHHFEQMGFIRLPADLLGTA